MGCFVNKKYTIHILSVTVIDGETFDLPPGQNAIIVCSDYKNDYVYQCLPENILVMDFPDVEDKNYPGAFNSAHARKIIGFISALSEQVTDIYVCCSEGASRSPAIAAAILRMSGRSDKAVWCNPYYKPNALVYSRLCHECGLPVTAFSVKLRTIINRRAFEKEKNGRKSRYERWQILY